MRLAIPHWQGQVSPVLDVSGALLVIDVEHGQAIGRQNVPMGEDGPLGRAQRIDALGVDTLICGAISRPLEQALTSVGVDIIAQTCGDVDEVLEAFLNGRLLRGEYLMPGCCGRRRRQRKGARRGRGDV